MLFNSLVQNISNHTERILRGSSIHIFGVCFAIILWILSISGFFSAFDTTLYDYYTKWTLKAGPEIKNIVVVEYKPEDWNIKSEDWENAIERLEEMGAKEIVFTQLLRHVDNQFWDKVSSYKNIIFGRKIIADPENPGENILEFIDPEIANRNLTFAAVGIPLSSNGIHRYENVNYELNDKKIDALPTIVAQKYLGHSIIFNKEKYLVNFSGGVERLPRVTLQKIIKNQIVPQLIKDKVILIGYGKDPNDVGLKAPGSNPNASLSLTEYQAFALDTLLDNKAIHEVPKLVTLILFLFIALMSTMLYVQLEARTVITLSIALIVLYVIISFAMLTKLNIWLPLIEMVIEQILLLVIFFYRKSFLENLSVMKMVIDLTVKLQEKVSPTGFYISPAYWTQIIVMVDQILNLNKVIFLQRIKGEHRLREVVGLRCSINDIDEKRRDYLRNPYRKAIAENQIIELTRGYFKNKEVDESEYLVPLTFGDEVVGFWAFTVKNTVKIALLETDETIQDFRNQISEMLYQHQIYEENRKLKEKFWLKYWFFEKSAAYSQLQKLIAVYNKHLVIHENIFDGLDTNSILYDLFGRVIKINKSMSKLMREEQVTPFVLTALDLLCKLSDLEQEQGKECIKLVIMDQRVLSFPIRLKTKPNNSYILTLRALNAESQKVTTDDEVYPFHTLGILLQVTDITKMVEFYRIKEEILNRIKIQFSGDLQSVLFAIYLLESKLEPVKKGKVIEMARDKTISSVAFISEAQKLLDVDLQYEFIKKFPINPKAPIIYAIDNLINELSSKNLTINQDVPELISLAFASPEELSKLIKAFLNYLIVDAVQGSQLQITLKENVNDISFILSNKGFGIPNENLHSYLHGISYLSISELKDIKDLIPNIAQWDGEFEAYSEIGVGTKFTLKLKRFI